MRKLSLALAAMTIAMAAGAQQHTISIDGNAANKLRIAEMAIANLYVDTVDESRLVEDAIRGMLTKLDPHSAYSTAKETQALTEQLQGSFEGIGVQFNLSQDTLLIIQPVAGGPSEKVGIVAGDRIVTVDDSLIAGVKMPREEIMRRLRGPKGTRVELGIVRRGVQGTLHFTVKRDKIPVKTLDAAYMIRPTIGYIRLTSFGATTYKEFMEAARKLQAAGMQDLIIDLQDNGGGYLQSAVMIAGELLERGDLIVYTQGRATRRQEYRAHGDDAILRQGRVMVLVDEFSASAAEILAGAIQDQDRGEVVGRRSFGKGLVQRPIEFKDGSMMRLTVAHYYTPSGRCIQKPYTKGDAEDYARELGQRYQRGELYSADSIHFADTLRYRTLRRGRTVYGGGGIMPDHFVPLDTTRYTAYHRSLAAHSIIINRNLTYIDQHRKALKHDYPTFEDFRARFEVPQTLIDQIVQDGEALKIQPRDDAERDRTMPMLRLQMKALIARDLWDMSEYYQIMNETSDVVTQAVSLLRQR